MCKVVVDNTPRKFNNDGKWRCRKPAGQTEDSELDLCYVLFLSPVWLGSRGSKADWVTRAAALFDLEFKQGCPVSSFGIIGG